MTFTLDASKLGRLDAALQGLSDPKFIRRAGLKGLREAAIPIRDRAKREAPKDEFDLEKSIAVKAGRKGRGDDADLITYQVGIDQNVDPPRQIVRQDGKGTFRDPGVAGHSVIIEYGRDGVPADPFFRRSFDAEKNATPQRIADELEPAIADQARKMAKKGLR